LRLLSRVFCGTLPSSPLAFTSDIRGAEHSLPYIAMFVMAARLFSLFPFTVTLRYLVLRSGILYLSGITVVPVLLPEAIFLNVCPSSETDITKL
jgi:hypothetical protein